MEQGTTLEKTQSLCPVCRKVLDARVVEEGGSVYMVKHCPEHGPARALLSKYAWYYKGLNSLYDKLSPAGHPMSDETVRAVLFHPTSRCNLGCSICFSHAQKESQEVSLEEVARMAKTIKGKKGVAIIGGEPTLHKDILEIIKVFTRAGRFVQLFTNGIKLSDYAFAKKLKETGVDLVQLGVDTLSDDGIYLKMRGMPLLEQKKRALEHLQKLKVRTGIIAVVVKNLTEKSMPEITDFVRKNPFLHEVSFRGYAHMGRKGFSEGDELAMDEMVEMFERETKGLVTLEEFYTFQRIAHILRRFLRNVPQCYVSQRIYIPRGNQKKVRDVFPPDVFEKHIRTFETIFEHDPQRAKRFFLGKMLSRFPQGVPLFIQHALAWKPFFDARYYLELEFALFYTPHTIDLLQIRKRCTDAWLPSYAEGRMEDYCGMLANTTGL